MTEKVWRFGSEQLTIGNAQEEDLEPTIVMAVQ